MRIERAINIEDLRRMAKRRLPRIAFDYIEGGVEDERCLERNEASFARYRLTPRYLMDVSRRDQSRMLFEHKYDSPFGIAPTGLAGLFRSGADLMLAQAASAANMPFVMSGASTATMEAAAAIAPSSTWYQLYAARDPKISEDMIRRASDCGLSTLVVTVDIPVNSKRERNLRNGFGLPLKLTPSIIADGLTHPKWLAEYLRHGMPRFENWSPYAEKNSTASTINLIFGKQTPATLTWIEIEKFRQWWPRKLVLKGILHPDDAARAVQLGVDGIWVSNHGGRQLDRAPSSVEAFPAIRAAVGGKATLMLDSGIRRGSDIVTALCLGAQFVFVGRATLYGAAAGGAPGVHKAIDILRDEIDRVMAQLGCASLQQLDERYLVKDPATTFE